MNIYEVTYDNGINFMHIQITATSAHRAAVLCHKLTKCIVVNCELVAEDVSTKDDGTIASTVALLAGM